MAAVCQVLNANCQLLTIMTSFTDQRVENYLYAMLPPREPVLQEMERPGERARHSHRWAGSRPALLSIRDADQRENGLRDGLGDWLLHHLVGEGGRRGRQGALHRRQPRERRRSAPLLSAGRCRRPHRVHVGDALETLSERKEQFDILFTTSTSTTIRGSSTWPPRACAKADCSSPTTHCGPAGGVTTRAIPDLAKDPDGLAQTEGVGELNRLLYSSPDWYTTIVPLRDGVAVALRL